MADFLPRADVKLMGWTRVFGRLIEEDPQRYGLTAGEAGAYAVTREAFVVALRDATRYETQGPRTVRLKNKSRQQLEDATRQLARQIRAHPGITSDELFQLGLVRHRERAEAVGVQTPRVGVRTQGRRLWVTLRGSKRRARPKGVVGAVINTFVGELPSEDFGEWTFRGNTTRPEWSRVVPNDEAPPGARVWVAACWLDRRLQPGPASRPVMASMGEGLVRAAA